MINQYKVGQEPFLERIKTFHITHVSTKTFKLIAALMKSSFPHFCWTAGPKISQHLLPETERLTFGLLAGIGIWKPYRESINALETLHQARICSLAAKRRFGHKCKFATKKRYFLPRILTTSSCEQVI